MTVTAAYELTFRAKKSVSPTHQTKDQWTSIELTMTRWAPFELWLFGPIYRHQRVDAHLGHPPLEHVLTIHIGVMCEM